MVDVHAKKSWTSAPKSGFSCGPGDEENLFDPWASGGRVRNVRRKSGPKSLCLCWFFFPKTRSHMESLTKENLVGPKAALTAISRTFTPLVRRIRFPW